MLALVCFIVAAILYFLVGIDVAKGNDLSIWGHFFVALGLALRGVDLPGPWRRD